MRSVLARIPTEQEREILQSSLAYFEQRFQDDRAAAESLIAVGDTEPPEEIDPRRLAAWTSVCLMLLNLDETLTKE